MTSRTSLLRRMEVLEERLSGPVDGEVGVILEEYGRLLRSYFTRDVMMRMEEMMTYRRKVAWFVENGGTYK